MRRAGIRRTGQKLVAFLLVVLLVFPMMVPAQAKAATTLMGKRASASDVVEATAENKKGIQGVEFWTDSSDTDMKNSVHHVYVNLELNNIINTDGTGTPYVYNGKTYYFNYENYIVVTYKLNSVLTVSNNPLISFITMVNTITSPANVVIIA